MGIDPANAIGCKDLNTQELAIHFFWHRMKGNAANKAHLDWICDFTMNHGASLFPGGTKNLKLVNHPDRMEHVLIKFDYMRHNFNKNKKLHPHVPDEDPENIEDVLEDGIDKELGKLSLVEDGVERSLRSRVSIEQKKTRVRKW
jgi:hypothetical protein